MELGLKGKNVVITGGGSNIGRAIVHAFAAEDCNIIIAELAPSQGEKVAAEVAASNDRSKVKVLAADVSDYQQVDRMVEQAIVEFTMNEAISANQTPIPVVPAAKSTIVKFRPSSDRGPTSRKPAAVTVMTVM